MKQNTKPLEYFIESSALRQYWQEIGFRCNALEATSFVLRSRSATIGEQFDKLEEIMATMPDMTIDGHPAGDEFCHGSLHEWIRRYMDHIRHMLHGVMDAHQSRKLRYDVESHRKGAAKTVRQIRRRICSFAELIAELQERGLIALAGDAWLSEWKECIFSDRAMNAFYETYGPLLKSKQYDFLEISRARYITSSRYSCDLELDIFSRGDVRLPFLPYDVFPKDLLRVKNFLRLSARATVPLPFCEGDLLFRRNVRYTDRWRTGMVLGGINDDGEWQFYYHLGAAGVWPDDDMACWASDPSHLSCEYLREPWNEQEAQLLEMSRYIKGEIAPDTYTRRILGREPNDREKEAQARFLRGEMDICRYTNFLLGVTLSKHPGSVSVALYSSNRTEVLSASDDGIRYRFLD